MQLLLDAEMAIFQFACRNEKRVDWDDESFSEWADAKLAIAEFDCAVASFPPRAGCDGMVMALSDTKNFRKKLCPTYKANRGPKPKLVAVLTQHVKNTYPVITMPWLEADDTISIIMGREPGEWTCGSRDKDLFQIPGRHWNWFKEQHVNVTPEEADMWFYQQILIGDPVDGYPGCPGQGYVKAAKLLDATAREDWWKVIVATYEKKGLGEKDALLQARLARILRPGDYDIAKKKPILWKPPTT